MSADTPGRSGTTDDLARAYAQANALVDDGGGPPAKVRANVLAAARDIAAASAARVAAEAAVTPGLIPVAPPVADVGRGRSTAINLSSWRVRSGVALAAMLLVGLAGWHFDAARRFNGGEQVAMAELRTAAPTTSRLPRELPVPPMSDASYPYLPPVIHRRVAVVPRAAPVPAAKAAAQGGATVAAADTGARRADVEASRAAFSGAGVGDALNRSAPNAAGALVAASTRLLSPPLQAAADRGDVEALKRLLADPATPVDAPDSAGRTALLHAVQAQQAAAVRLLLAAGADPARADQAGLTPSTAAQTGASAEIATLLAAPR